MDMFALVRAMSRKEFLVLVAAVKRRQVDEAQADSIGLTEAEMVLVKQGNRISAIKSVRDREMCSLMVAKMAVDKSEKE